MYVVHLLQAIELLVFRVTEPQHHRPCVCFVVASTPPTLVHQQLLHHMFAQALYPSNRVFIVNLKLYG